MMLWRCPNATTAIDPGDGHRSAVTKKDSVELGDDGDVLMGLRPTRQSRLAVFPTRLVPTARPLLRMGLRLLDIPLHPLPQSDPS